ncbi:hypothetical protein BDZ45DRAFT_749783 [Acephala macrosclerotiorum]|nr:hypothetical protein BDZ45DRAFT_749783 [Acephala macrosclerotiorum]
MLIAAGLWIAAIFVPYPGKVGLIVGAIVADYPVDIFLRSPRRERHEGFFIVILGEDVFRLIERSPSGMGIHSGAATVVTALLIYYGLHWLYFNSDSMFASLLIVAASTLFLVEYRTGPKSIDTVTARASANEGEDKSDAVSFALWSASTSLPVALFSMTVMALLNRPFDPPKTLLANNRYIRLAVIFVIACLLKIKNLTGLVAWRKTGNSWSHRMAENVE